MSWQTRLLGLTSLVTSAPSKAFPNEWRCCDVSWRCNASGTAEYLMPEDPKITDYKSNVDHRGEDVSDSDILSDIQRVARILGKRPSLSEYAVHGTFSETAVNNHFGKWSTALSEAGFSDIPVGKKKQITDEELLEELRDAADAEGRPPRARSENVEYCDETYRQRFGSWLNALDEAGVGYDRRQVKKPITDKVEFSEIVDAIIEVAVKKDRPPYEKEVQRHGEIPFEATTAVAGSWSETLRMAGFPPRYQGGLFTHHDARSKKNYGTNWEEVRKRALSRDRWRCQHCGLSNSDHNEKYGDSLHVHHIQPLHQFDEPENANFLANLITLCQVCHNKWEPSTQLYFSDGSEGR